MNAEEAKKMIIRLSKQKKNKERLNSFFGLPFVMDDEEKGSQEKKEKKASVNSAKQEGGKMSKESYMAGFCKKAAEYNVDPRKLAQFAAQKFEKEAAGDVWGTVKQFLETAKQNAGKAWNSIDPKLRPLAGGAIGAGVGAGGGAILGKLLGVGAGKGAIAGLGIGGISGSALGAKSWNDFVTAAHKNEVAKLNEGRAGDVKAHAEEVAKLNEQIKALQVASGASTNNNSELKAALEELEAQKRQVESQAGMNYVEQFMKNWEATKATMAPKASPAK